MEAENHQEEEKVAFLRHDFLYKVVILGDTKAGKTSLVRKFTENKFTEEYFPTFAVDFKTKVLTVNGKTIKLQIW